MEQTYNIRQVNLKTYTEDGKNIQFLGSFQVGEGHEKIFSLAYRLTDAEIRVGDSKDIRENEICAVISKRPKGMYQTRSYEVT